MISFQQRCWCDPQKNVFRVPASFDGRPATPVRKGVLQRWRRRRPKRHDNGGRFIWAILSHDGPPPHQDRRVRRPQGPPPVHLPRHRHTEEHPSLAEGTQRVLDQPWIVAALSRQCGHHQLKQQQLRPARVHCVGSYQYW